MWRPCTRRRAISQQHASRAREMRWPTPSASKSACDAQLRVLHQRHATAGTTVTAEEERDIVTRMVLTDGARRRRFFEEACATVAATVTSVSAAALGVGEESEDENEMGPEEEPLGVMRSEGATDLGD